MCYLFDSSYAYYFMDPEISRTCCGTESWYFNVTDLRKSPDTESLNVTITLNESPGAIFSEEISAVIHLHEDMTSLICRVSG